MAVAVKTETAEPTGQRGAEPAPMMNVAAASWLGAGYIILAFLLAFHTVPWLWESFVYPPALGEAGLFARGAQFLLIMATAVGLMVLWAKIRPAPQPGARAGAFLGVVTVLGTAVLAFWAARLGERFLGNPAGVVVPTVVVLAIAVFTWRKYQQERFQRSLIAFEEQGWFSWRPYKKEQGKLVRRGTMFGILTLVGAGLWVYIQRRHLVGGNDWIVEFPFGLERLVILRSPNLTLTAVIFLLALWFAFRLVNLPRFGDFLIATEAEMNKVSWSSRKRLIQDTIVVLTTVLLMTLFLLAVDLLWTFLLRDILGVIRVRK